MNETCPVCHYRFERAPGYFLGAMGMSYALATAVLVALIGILHVTVLRSWSIERIGLLAGVVYLFLIPAVFRWSRILWIHLGARLGW